MVKNSATSGTSSLTDFGFTQKNKNSSSTTNDNNTNRHNIRNNNVTNTRNNNDTNTNNNNDGRDNRDNGNSNSTTGSLQNNNSTTDDTNADTNPSNAETNVDNLTNTNDNNNNDNNGGDNNDNDEENVDDDDTKEEYWPPYTKLWFDKIKKEIDDAVDFQGRGNTSFFGGEIPKEYRFIIRPSEDIQAFVGNRVLTQGDFCLPNLHIWFPEALHQRYYENARPPCPWHKDPGCVVLKGWVEDPRHCYTDKRITALLCKKYQCSIRKGEKVKPFTFRGYDEKVIAASDDYIQQQWKMNGYDISHRAAISLSLLEDLRSDMIQALSVSGFRRALLEAAKQFHFRLGIQWRAYVDSLLKYKKGAPHLMFLGPGQVDDMRRDFVKFNTKEYGQPIPSVSYLIARVVRLMEEDTEYQTKRMQMVDGKHLSGDHSFKLTKCVLSNHVKAFTALYTLMNEHGQVVGFWFTTGTGMDELKEVLSKINTRYQQLGFDKLCSFTTDRCCQERKYLRNVFELTDDVSNSTLGDNNEVNDTAVVDVVVVPSQPKVAYNLDMTNLLVGEISRYFINKPTEHMIFAFDCEWKIGNIKADVLQIGLSNGATYVFHLSIICGRTRSFPRCLKMLLENENLRKVGNRVHTDVKALKGWNVDVNATVELGHIAHARGLCNKRPSLHFLVSLLWPGVVLEGKDGSGPRISDWSRQLSDDQLKYCAGDAYTTIMVYLKLMQIMDPKVQRKLNVNDITEGLVVAVYSSGWKTRVADATVVGKGKTGHYVRLKLDLGRKEKICTPGTFIDVIQEDGSTRTEAISALYLESEVPPTVEFEWSLHFCRQIVNRSESDVPIQINTKQKQVARDESEPSTSSRQNYDADYEAAGNNSDSSDGGNDIRVPLPRGERQRHRQYRKEKVKNDIAHIFFRFERALSKEHGAFVDFIRALRDAMFVLDQRDLDQCMEVLREKRKMSEEEIQKMMTYDFAWFLRRVKRTVPSPPELERRYLAVYEVFKDIVCTKSGKKLFETKHGKSTHLSCLKHIRRNCLSDIPSVSYYYPVGEDKDGLVLYKCLRGTSALEGLHQKLRQLVRGFSTSPRLMKALLSTYLLRWNQNIEVEVRGLSDEYDGLYDGNEIEEEIAKMAKWKNRVVPPHPDWISTRNVASTGETFGLIDPVSTDTNETDEALLDKESELAVVNLLELDTGVGDIESENALTKMPESSCWLARHFGRWRPSGRVKGEEEWNYFNEHIGNFQGGAGNSTEADNYSSIQFSAFADHWNEWVASLGHDKPSVTYKSASHLQDAHKSMQKRARRSSTLLPHASDIASLRQNHTSSEANQPFVNQFVESTNATRTRPNTIRSTGTQTDALEELDDDNFPDTSASPMKMAISAGNRHTNTRKRPANRPKSNSKPRCRKCGKQYSLPEWIGFHPNNVQQGSRKSSDYLRHGEGNNVWDRCTVDPSDYEPGFPCLDGHMPRIKKSRQV